MGRPMGSCRAGTSVDVVQARFGQYFLEAPGNRRGQFATAAEDISQILALTDLIDLQKQLQHRRHEHQRRNPLLAHRPYQIVWLEMAARAGQHQAPAHGQRPEQFPGRSIEAERNLLQHARLLTVSTDLLTPQQQVAQATMGNHRRWYRRCRSRRPGARVSGR